MWTLGGPMLVLLSLGGLLVVVDLVRLALRARSQHTTAPGRCVVLYDGHCRFCTAQARNLERLTGKGRIELRSFQYEGVLAQFPGVTHESCMKAMQLITPGGRVHSGFAAAVHAVATNWWGVVAYLYYLPGVRLLCDAIYELIARNRYRLMGKQNCDDGTCQLHLKRG